MAFLAAIKAAVVTGAKFLWGVIKHVGPLKVVGVIATAAAAAVPIAKLVKKVVTRIKTKGKDRAPSTMTEMAISDSKTRESNPEALQNYNESVKRTAERVFGNKKKPKNWTLKALDNKLKNRGSAHIDEDEYPLRSFVEGNDALRNYFNVKSPCRPPFAQ